MATANYNSMVGNLNLDHEADRKTYYFNQCLKFTSNLENEEVSYSFYVKIGADFVFSVNNRCTTSTSNQRKQNKNKVKYVSPSTRRRNNLRLLAFKAKRAAKGGKSPTRSGAPPPLTRTFRVGREM